jgi:HlyD family secretion protein
MNPAHRLWAVARRRPRESGAASIGMLIALGGLAFSVSGRDTATSWPAATVGEGAFLDAIVETGTVNAARLMLYGAPVGPAQSKIVALVPEGSQVAPGDELVRFDDSAIGQSLEQEQATLRQAEAELLQAQEDLRIEELQVQSSLEATTLAVGFAERELTNQMEGQGRLALIEAQAARAEAGREVERTKAAYEDTRALLPEGFVTRLEVDRAEQAYRRAEELARLADVRLETLTRYERPATIDRSMAAVSAAHADLGRARDTAASRLAQRQAARSAAGSRVDESRARVAELERQLARTVVRADGPGLVVYRDLYFGGDRRKPQVGDEVWPNQPLIALPDSTQLIVETRVREIDLHKVEASQRVRVRFDAYPDLTLPASVALVGALAQDDAARAGTKYFPVTVRLLESDDRLRTGMTAQVEIEIAAIDRTRLVPVQAVFRRAQDPYAVVIAHGAPARVPVRVLAENGMVAALERDESLPVGTRVLLVDPTASPHDATSAEGVVP